MKVTVKKYLNVRVGEPSVNAPCYQYLAPGSVLEVDGVLYDGDLFEDSDKWMKDSAGNYYWAGGVEKTQLLTEITKPTKVILPDTEWWMNSLAIPKIWDMYNEQGERAKVAILDSGYNVSITDLSEGVEASQTFIQGTINDNEGHGTHCGSLIGGRNRNFTVGSAPRCKLYVGKITDKGGLRYQTLVRAIQWAIDNKVDIISISYGGESDNADLKLIIEKAIKNNIVVLASIGDKVSEASLPCFPALYEKCIAVGSIGKKSLISDFTIKSNKTEIYSPGEDIQAYGISDQLEERNGTSQATAIVAGICALIISRFKLLNKNYTVDDIRTLLNVNSDITEGNKKIISPLKIFSKI